jgi:hypothetical protein
MYKRLKLEDELLLPFHCAENTTKTNSNVQKLVARPARACVKNLFKPKNKAIQYFPIPLAAI